MEKDSVVVNYHNAAGEVLASYSNKAKERSKKLTLDKGANTFVWDTRGTGAERLEGMILWWANLDGPKAVPGAYKVSMSVGDQTIATHDFSILPDPRAEASVADMQAQYNFITKVNTTINDAHDAIKNIREKRCQYTGLLRFHCTTVTSTACRPL